MSQHQIIGFILLSIPFIFVFVAVAAESGLKAAIALFIVGACILSGIYFLQMP